MANSKPNTIAPRTDTKPQSVEAQPVAGKNSKSQDPDQPRQPSKLDLIRSLLARPDGASLYELVAATGWQPHSVRAGMTGLRKQGLTITRTKAHGTTRFAIDAQPAKAAA